MRARELAVHLFPDHFLSRNPPRWSPDDSAVVAVPQEGLTANAFVPLYGWTFENRPRDDSPHWRAADKGLKHWCRAISTGRGWLRLEALAGGRFNLRHPQTSRYLCAHPPKENAPRPVEINPITPQEWETFRLERLELDVVPAAVRAIADAWAGEWASRVPHGGPYRRHCRSGQRACPGVVAARTRWFVPLGATGRSQFT